MDRQLTVFKRKNLAGVSDSRGLAITLLGLCLLNSPGASALADNWNVDGEHGVLNITGALSQGACRLEMNSERQLVQLGNISTGDLVNQGDRAEPVPFQIVLRDCLLTGGRQRDARTSNVVWDASQPVVSVSFVAPADSDSPQLVKVVGAKGMGLRLLDGQHRDVRLGSRSQPQFISLYNDVLTYYVIPERTSGPLEAGAFKAAVNFRLNYD